MIPHQISDPRKSDENGEKHRSRRGFPSTGLPEVSAAFQAFPQRMVVKWSSGGLGGVYISKRSQKAGRCGLAGKTPNSAVLKSTAAVWMGHRKQAGRRNRHWTLTNAARLRLYRGSDPFKRRSLDGAAGPNDLVEAARCGSALEIERLLQAVWPVAYRLAYSVLGDRETAEDAARNRVSSSTAPSRLCAIRRRSALGSRIVVREASSLKRRHVESNVGKEPASRLRTERRRSMCGAHFRCCRSTCAT